MYVLHQNRSKRKIRICHSLELEMKFPVIFPEWNLLRYSFPDEYTHIHLHFHSTMRGNRQHVKSRKEIEISRWKEDVHGHNRRYSSSFQQKYAKGWHGHVERTPTHPQFAIQIQIQWITRALLFILTNACWHRLSDQLSDVTMTQWHGSKEGIHK
jgi:hypothetical protein